MMSFWIIFMNKNLKWVHLIEIYPVFNLFLTDNYFSFDRLRDSYFTWFVSVSVSFIFFGSGTLNISKFPRVGYTHRVLLRNFCKFHNNFMISYLLDKNYFYYTINCHNTIAYSKNAIFTPIIVNSFCSNHARTKLGLNSQFERLPELI